MRSQPDLSTPAANGGRNFSRRAWMAAAAGGVFAPYLGSTVSRGEGSAAEGLIVRNRRPLDLETPVGALDRWLTPNDAFFVRSHLGMPAFGLAPWSVEVGGLVDRPARLRTANLAAFPQVTLPAVLQCSGNGRAFFRPAMPGVIWERGAVGHAEWTGVRLADVLARGGGPPPAAHVHFLGADGPPSPKTPLFLRSLPLDKALHEDTLLATAMNGEPLPALHGGPVRLVVPGWSGNHWMKWVRMVTVAADEAPGFYMQTGYRIARSPAPPDAVLKPSDLVPVTELNVKSLITWPPEGATLRPGPQEIRGVAWTGEGHVTRVEVDAGAGRWGEATLLGEPRPWAWRQWRLAWDAPAHGKVVLAARATDSRGHIQPETTPWNKSGYLWNGIDRVTCEVG